MGGGRLHMVPNDEVMPGSSKKGKRRDGQNLMRMWEEEMSKKNGRFEKKSFKLMYHTLNGLSLDKFL